MVTIASAPEGTRRSGIVALVRRVPFTTGFVVLTVVLGLALGTMWSDVDGTSWFRLVGYGLPAFQDGRWYTLISGMFFALHPVYYVFVAGAFAVLTGFAEYRLGTARTVVLTLGFQGASVLLTAAFFLAFRGAGWDWVQQRSTETDVGLSAGMLAVLAVASATVRPPWRLRLRLSIWVYVLFSVMFVGQMADAEHLVAVLLSLPFSSALAGPRGLRAPALPTRREVRLLAFVAVLVVAGSQLVGVFLPNRLTPFGPGENSTDTWYFLVVNLVITVLIANGLRRGKRWAWWVEMALLAVPLVLSAVVIVLYLIGRGAPDMDARLDGIPQFSASAVLSLVFFLLLLLTRRSFRVPRRGTSTTGSSHPDTARTLLRRWGGGTVSWMTTWPENSHLITADGRSYVAFVRHAGVGIVLGDPVGPPGSLSSTLVEYVALCDRAGLVPFLFSCTAETVAVTDRLGWQSAQVAEDNVIDLPELAFTGKKWQDIRTALNRAPQAGVQFRMVRLADEPWSLVRQVELMSEEWLGEKKLPEMGFTLGGVDEALDTEVRVGLAVDADGLVHGVTSWLPVYGPGDVVVGWTLDLMRRRADGFRSTMEFLIASSCLHFKEEGAQFLSLSGAPLARSSAAEHVSAIERLLDSLGATLEPVYGFRSLHAFKRKFQPRLSPMYMAFRDEADLPRIGVAITRAYLPTAGVGDLLGVVRH